MAETVIRLPERPFPIMWEQSPERDGCPHDWEAVYAEQRPGVFVEVGRCAKCHTPRCDRVDKHHTQCVERRHHRDLHIFESGTFDPVGGYLDPVPVVSPREGAE